MTTHMQTTCTVADQMAFRALPAEVRALAARVMRDAAERGVGYVSDLTPQTGGAVRAAVAFTIAEAADVQG